MRNRFSAELGFVVVQLAAALTGFILIAVAPPAQGRMMLVPLGQLARNQVAALAIENGAQLIQTGPFPSSLIVSGERAKLLAPLGGHGIMVVAAGVAGCGRIAA